jgi:hypothetical protein
MAQTKFRENEYKELGLAVRWLDLAEYANDGQFIQGLYCESCAVGFVPEFMANPAAPRYQSSTAGWRRVFTDGTLGPLLQRIADDPESQFR